MLEAGAAAVATVATNVGACREILTGRRDELPALGDGGILTDVASPEQTASAIAMLLRDPARRERYGRVMRERVKQHYDHDLVDAAYAAIYGRHKDAPSQPLVHG